MAELFDGYYYAHGCGVPYRRDEGWLAQFGRIADAMIRELQPQTVLDVGCAIGLLVEALRTRGVEAYGIDVSEYAIGEVHPSIREFCRVGEATAPFGRQYDLITCIEVLEHMPPEAAPAAVANLCAHAGGVLFSSSPLDFAEVTHFNVQGPEYWARLFAQQGFFRAVDVDAAFLTPWAVYFRRDDRPQAAIVADYERRFWHLRQESHARVQVNLAQREQLAQQEARLEALVQEAAALRGQLAEAQARAAAAEELEREVADLRAQLAAIENSAGGRLLHTLQGMRASVAPPGSQRDKLLGAVLGGSTPAAQDNAEPHSPQGS
jgi:SAM-dependent methyltransferase